MTTTTEIAPDVYRISTYVPLADLQFNQFLAKDDELWDAGVIFEETQGTLFCSDLFHQNGMVEALTESDIVGRSRHALIGYQASFLMDYMPFTPKTEQLLKGLATLRPRTLAAMHGSTFIGDGARAPHDLGGVMREVYGEGDDH
jgi:hypothetical protein